MLANATRAADAGCRHVHRGAHVGAAVPALCRPVDAIRFLAKVCAPPEVSCDSNGYYYFKYDGYEDCRALVHNGQLFLVANHEDCYGQRHLCLIRCAAMHHLSCVNPYAETASLRLNGSALDGTLAADAVWPLRVEGDDIVQQAIEKNWAPFEYGGQLYMSYSLQVEAQNNCAWPLITSLLEILGS